MSTDGLPRPEECTCLAVRQAARHITQFCDQHLAAAGLRTTQYSILAQAQAARGRDINALADAMVMDRTTLGRNILPLERDGLISIDARPHRPSQQGAAVDGGGGQTAASRA